MGKNDRQSRDQKRKAKLKKRAERSRKHESLAYAGTKYKTDAYAPLFFRTEIGIYESYVMCDRELTDDEVEAAIERIEQGKGTDEDLETILDVGDNIIGRAFCALGDAVPVPFSSAVKYFRDEIIQHQKEGGCPFDPAATTLWADR